MAKKHAFFGWLAGGLILLFSCGGDDNPNAETASLTINLLPSAVEGLLNSTRTPLATRLQISPPAVGQTTTSSLTSLQYFIREIRLCKDITTSGTGYSGVSDCISLYRTADDAASSETFYNEYTVSDALNDEDEGHFIDLVSEAGREQLASTPTSLTSAMIGDYHYGVIDYMRPIRMKAEFKNSDGEVVAYTKTPTTSQIQEEETSEGGMEFETVRLDNSTTAPAELMTYMLNNGGKWFPFLQPFSITEEDINAKESIQLDFVFNPNGFSTATHAASCEPSSSNPFPVFDETNCVSFDLPYAQFSPVPRRSGESTLKEVYLVDYITEGAQQSQLRVEIYYNDGDETKSVQGVDLAVIMDPNATEGVGNIVQALEVTEAENVLTFYGWNENSGEVDAISLSGLERETDGDLLIHCIFSGGPCSDNDGSTFSRSYTYEGSTSLTD